MSRKKVHPLTVIGVALAAFILLVSVALRPKAGNAWLPLARPDERAPLGGKALRLLLERQGLRVQTQRKYLQEMPDAKLWILLDPGTRFSQQECEALVEWVKRGNTLIWADSSNGDRASIADEAQRAPSLEILRQASGVAHKLGPYFRPKAGLPLPPLSPMREGAASIYRTGVSKASGSGDGLQITSTHLPILTQDKGLALARVEVGRGRIFVTPDALPWTNMALAHDDNAILLTNIVRAHTRPGDLVVWDQREHDAPGETRKPIPSLLYFLWQPPLRWALLQVLAAGALLALFWGRRLGRAVPLSSPPNALRASQWALAMSQLFQKVDRPHVAAQTSGEHFRRALARRVGASPAESDEVLASRAAQAAEIDPEETLHLLNRARTPDKSPEQMLRDVQQMERVLEKLSARR